MFNNSRALAGFTPAIASSTLSVMMRKAGTPRRWASFKRHVRRELRTRPLSGATGFTAFGLGAAATLDSDFRLVLAFLRPAGRGSSTISRDCGKYTTVAPASALRPRIVRFTFL